MQSEPKHTPGGWGRNIKPASKYPIIYAGRNTHVAQIITRGLPVSEQEANADLVAASPLLLAALKAFISRAQGLLDEPDTQWAWEKLGPEYRQACAAIARTEGIYQ